MILAALTTPVFLSFVALSVPMRTELLPPVRLVGGTAWQSPADQATSLRHHHLGLLCQHLQSFEALGNNWDGHGAVPPSAQAVGHAMTLLNELPGEWVLRLHTDDLTPTPYGTLTLEWATGPEYVSLEIGDDQWAYTAEVGGELHRSPNIAYADAAVQYTVSQALQALFSDAVPHDADPYTA